MTLSMYKTIATFLLIATIFTGCNQLTIGTQYNNLKFTDELEGFYVQILNSKTQNINAIYKLQKENNQWSLLRTNKKKFIPMSTYNLSDKIYEYPKSKISTLFDDKISISKSRCIGNARHAICKFYKIPTKEYKTAILLLNAEGKALLGLPIYKKTYKELKVLGF